MKNDRKKFAPPPRCGADGPTLEVVDLPGRRIWSADVQHVELIPCGAIREDFVEATSDDGSRPAENMPPTANGDVRV